MCSVNNDAVPAEVDETQSHMKPVVVLETLDLSGYIISSINLYSCFWKLPCNIVLSYWWYLCRKKSAHTHTHPFNGPLSETTRVSRHQKGKTNVYFTDARDSEWQWHQLGHMQVCTLLQTTPHHSVFLQAECPSCCPSNSVKALKVEKIRKLQEMQVNVVCQCCTNDKGNMLKLPVYVMIQSSVEKLTSDIHCVQLDNLLVVFAVTLSDFDRYR